MPRPHLVDALPRPLNALLPVLGEARHDEERGGVEEDVVADGLDKVRGRVDRKEGDEVRRVVGRRAARDGGEVVDGQAKVGGVDGVLANRRLQYYISVGISVGIGIGIGSGRGALDLPHVRIACDGDLVEVLGAAHDERVLDGSVAGEGVREHGTELGARDADDEAGGARGVHERAEEVEERAVGERAAERAERGETGVVVWREEEVEVRVLRGGDPRVRGGGRERAAQRLQQIGRA